MTDDGKSTEELQRECFRTLSWYFAERPTGFYAQLGQIKDQLATLNQRLAESDESSKALTRSLNRLTLAGVIVASVGVLVAAGNLALEIIKHSNNVGS